MSRMINIGYGNVVNADKILAVGGPAAPPKNTQVAGGKEKEKKVVAH